MKPMRKYKKDKDMCCYCGQVNGHKDNCPIRPIIIKGGEKNV